MSSERRRAEARKRRAKRKAKNDRVNDADARTDTRQPRAASGVSNLSIRMAGGNDPPPPGGPAAIKIDADFPVALGNLAIEGFGTGIEVSDRSRVAAERLDLRKNTVGVDNAGEWVQEDELNVD